MAEKKRILFVDDEANILAALQRILRRQREDWEMYFVGSGQQALELLRQQPFDVIVTDVKMPGMDGEELLEQVVQLYPSMARIILSGHVDDAAAAKTVEFAHQFLPKPSEPEQLKAAIIGALKTQQRITDPRIREVFGNVGKIPALPKVYEELNTALRSDQADARSIAAIISRDMSISAKLLQLVNSSFFGLGRRVSSVADAVTLLGVKQLQALILSSHVFEAFSSGNLPLPISIDELWRQSMLAANLARSITLSLGLGEDRPDQAYMGGLLHNLGLLLFSSRMPEKFGHVVSALSRDSTARSEVLEREYLGASHTEAAAYLLGLWHLPPRIVEAVMLQSCPAEVAYNGVCGLTAVHAAVAIMAETAEPPCVYFAYPLDMAYLDRLGLGGRIDDWRKHYEKLSAKAHSEALEQS